MIQEATDCESSQATDDDIGDFTEEQHLQDEDETTLSEEEKLLNILLSNDQKTTVKMTVKNQ